jgi:hypothetical protein
LGIGTVAAVVDPEAIEKLLWTPTKKIFIPAPRRVIGVSGISLNFVRQYDVDLSQMITRINALYGWAPIRGDKEALDFYEALGA